jgi:hypothetical protein
MTRNLRFIATDRLIEADPKALGQRIPEPLHARVDALCDLVYEAGEAHRPTKAEMIAALILGAPEDPARLLDLVKAYGRACVRDAALGDGDDADVIDLPRRKSGPRSPRRS